MSVKKYAQLYLHFVSSGIRAKMQYRYAFIMSIVGMIVAYAGTAATMWVMLYRFEFLDGWNVYELVFLLALAVVSWGFCVIFFLHFRSLDTYIVNGTFDRFLVRPINPFFHYMSMRFSVESLGAFIFGIIIFVWVSIALELAWTVGKILFIIGAMVGGVLIQGGMLVMISAIAFWTTKSERFYWVVMFPARSLTNYPLSIYPKLIQWFAAFVVPFGFVNYFPALILLEKSTEGYLAYLGYFSPLVGLLFFGLSYRIWMWGLNYYKSTGS